MDRNFGKNALLASLALVSLGIHPASAAPDPGKEIAAALAPLLVGVQDAGELVNQARQLMKDGKFAEALPKLNEAIKARPDYAAAYQDRATALFQLKRFPEALKDFAEVIKLRPQAPAGYFNRGVVLLNLPTPDYKNALADFSKVIELNPKAGSTGLNLVLESYDKRAFANLQLNQWQAAIADCTQVIQADPKRANAYLNRAFAYTKLSPPDTSKAISDYGAALSNATTADDKLTVYLSRAELYLNSNQLPEAVADLSESLKLKNDNVDAYAARAAAHFQLKKYAEAIADYDQVARLKPADSGVYRDRAAAHMQLKAYPKAVADYSEFLRRVPSPEKKDVFKFRAAAYMQLSPPNYTAAIPDYQAYLAANSGDATAWHDLAAASFLASNEKDGPLLDQALNAAEKSLAINAGQADMNLVKADGYSLKAATALKTDAARAATLFNQAVPAYTRYIGLKANDPAGYEGRGRAYFNLKKYAEARADFEQFLAKAPANDKSRPEIEGLIANAADQTGGVSAADKIALYTKAINSNPQNPVSYTNRGVAYFNSGDFESAHKDFAKAAELDGGTEASLVNLASATFRKAEKSKTPADYQAAAAAYTRVLGKNPGNADALAARADINLALKQYAAAIADYTKFLQASPNAKETTAVLTNRAAAALLLPTPDYKSAIADYTQVLAKTPGDATAYNLRGLAYKNQKDYANAVADFTKYLDLTKPKVDTEILLARAESYYNLGMARKMPADFDGAIADYTAYLAAKPGTANVLYSRGLAYYRKSNRKTLADLDKAIADFDAATKAKPDSVDAWYRLGLAADDYGVASEPDQPKMFGRAVEAYTKFTTLPGVSQADVDMTKKRIQELKDVLNG